ncbi:MAG: Dabb family protein [Opitutaceae bacterium]|nr:Dabb family protein [Verrucomicrobiales bacterium]
MNSTLLAADEAPYRHVVVLKFKADAPAAELKKIEEGFVALKGKIDTVQEIEWGLNESPEGFNDGFTHVFFVTFKNKAGVETYITHPEHVAFVTLLKTQMEKVLVVDYVPKGK